MIQGNMALILEEEKTPHFYSEAQAKQKHAFLVQLLIFIWPKFKMKF